MFAQASSRDGVVAAVGPSHAVGLSVVDVVVYVVEGEAMVAFIGGRVCGGGPLGEAVFLRCACVRRWASR